MRSFVKAGIELSSKSEMSSLKPEREAKFSAIMFIVQYQLTSCVIVFIVIMIDDAAVYLIDRKSKSWCSYRYRNIYDELIIFNIGTRETKKTKIHLNRLLFIVLSNIYQQDHLTRIGSTLTLILGARSVSNNGLTIICALALWLVPIMPVISMFPSFMDRVFVW